MDDEAIRQRLQGRVVSRKDKGFEEIVPKPVIAAEAVTALGEEGAEGDRKHLKSRACFIATAAYGDPDAPEVESLRRFRDRYLLNNMLGSLFVRAYYRCSPPLARFIAARPEVRAVVRRALNSLVGRRR